MRYLLAIFAATIIAASMDACDADKPKRAVLTVMPAQNDTLFLARNDFDTLDGETQEMREIIERIKASRARPENWKIERNKYSVLSKLLDDRFVVVSLADEKG